MQFDDLTGDREAKAGAAFGARGRAVELPELFEHALAVVGGDPRPGICDRDLERAIGGSHVHRDLPVLGELDRVADQVEQHLRDPPVIALAEGQALL